jgi:hypothetical protein
VVRTRLLAFAGAVMVFVATCGLPSIKPPSLP